MDTHLSNKDNLSERPMDDAQYDRSAKVLEIKDMPLDREVHPRISYPFSDTEDSETEGPSPTRHAGSGISPPLPIPKLSSHHVSWKSSKEAVGSGGGGGDDEDDSDEGGNASSLPQRGVTFAGEVVVGSNGSASGWGSLDTEKVLKSGYLRKKGEKRKTWKTRWFVLRTNKLAYYKNDKEYELLNIIPLENITTVADVDLAHRGNVFGIITRDRTYFLQGSSPTEMESWTFIMREALKEFQKYSGGPPPPIRPRMGSNDNSRQNSGVSSPGVGASTSAITVGKSESKVQFADSVIVTAAPPSNVGTFPRRSNSGQTTTATPNSEVVTEFSPLSSSSSPIKVRSSNYIALPSKSLLGVPLVIDPTDETSSQLSGQESVVTNSSILTCVSTPSMLPVAPTVNGNEIHTSSTERVGASDAIAAPQPALISEIEPAATAAATTAAAIPIILSTIAQSPTTDSLDFIPVNETPSSPTKQPNSMKPTLDSKLGPHSSLQTNNTVPPPTPTSAATTPNSATTTTTTTPTTTTTATATATTTPLPKSALRKPRGQSFPDSARPISDVIYETKRLNSIQGRFEILAKQAESDLGLHTSSGKEKDAGTHDGLSSSDEDEEGSGLFGGPSTIGSRSVGGGGSSGAGIGSGVDRHVGQEIVGVTDNSVIREGYLLKQGTKYNKEYIVKRIVPLRTVLDILEIDAQGKQYCFKVVLAKRTLILSANTNEEMVNWIEDLRRIHLLCRGEI
ncbi:hypothetical protein BDR26DRAFT_896510 [Obelidium mucronatum]|nr:hypothetical protein BDR26DRAFT_896510 [Obelidium mucronatum]